MFVSYNKLWKILIDKNISNTELRNLAGVSTNVIAKLGLNDTVSMDSLAKICTVLDRNIGDIMDMSNGKEEKVNNG